MSWSSRAIRARSSATATRAIASRSRSACSARCSAASASSARSRTVKPPSHPIANRSGVKTSSPGVWVGLLKTTIAAPPITIARPEPHEHGVAQVAEQERRGHTGDERADGEDDQPPVDERERRGEHPDRRRGGEGEAPAGEQRQHDNGDGRSGEPRSRGRRAGGVLPQHDFDRALDCRQNDQRVEAMPPYENPEPSHIVNVLHASGLRLLPEDESEIVGRYELGSVPRRPS